MRHDHLKKEGRGAVPGRDLLQDLNPRQQRFVMSNARTILALAGPGSGKARCLTYRAAKLIREHSSQSDHVDHLTNRAAHEIRAGLQS